MGSILPYTTATRRRARPLQKGAPRGEIVIFSGVRIERESPPPPTLPQPAPAKAGG
ncbi:hypothetical protein SAMN02745157_0586 [Kaistia soli DSM 19436]|uniref:Uncharacterized protein n=1 Tax=Kaistia soli DSM 19436 TaxID=1122133 RepID=A0A1M4V1C8_9HYPH|nr:hypothetical protein [Kaistia soli]SHE62784.1 hypothetical protein SAMN02745157_0586 [Kaistia soli DSM 19436]